MSNNDKAVLTTEIAGVPVELALTNYGNRIQLAVQSVNGAQPSCGNLFGVGLTEDRTKLTGFVNDQFLANEEELNKYVNRDERGALIVTEDATYLPFSDLIVESPEEDEAESDECTCEYCEGYRAGFDAAS